MHRYRADIDGLRAVAVIAVILFHADVDYFSGGYVGVDVFFVISGFLITGIILSEIETGRFTIAGFYERRIRRIFPALFTVMIAGLAVGSFVLLPADFADFGAEVASMTLFVSNFHFANSSGYFDGASELKPLLHTWSLAVEEQFYIFFPVVLVALERFAKQRKTPVIAFILAASLLLSIWTVEADPVAAFYLAPSRVWELMIGALLAMGSVPVIRDRRLRELTSMAGLMLILSAVLVFSDSTPFPGKAALVPCLGTALIIHAGASGTTSVGRILSLRPVVFIGLISYSLYLWHWILLVFCRQYFAVVNLPPHITAAALLISLVVSILSWRFVERVFRDRRRISRRPIFVAGATAMALTLAVGLSIVSLDGFPQRFDEPVVELAATESDASENGLNAGAKIGSADDVFKREIGVKRAAIRTFVFWGDSHADAFYTAMNKAAREAGRSGVHATLTGCAPLLGVYRKKGTDKYLCRNFNDSVLGAILGDDSLHTVILAARWALSAEGRRYKNESKRKILITDDFSPEASLAENRAVFARGLDRTLKALRNAGREVVIVGPVPEPGFHVPRSLAMQQRTDTQREIAPTFDEFLERQEFVLRTLDDSAEKYDATVIYPHEALCDRVSCPVVRQGRSLYSDEHHLSRWGAVGIYQIFKPIFY